MEIGSPLFPQIVPEFFHQGPWREAEGSSLSRWACWRFSLLHRTLWELPKMAFEKIVISNQIQF